MYLLAPEESEYREGCRVFLFLFLGCSFILSTQKILDSSVAASRTANMVMAVQLPNVANTSAWGDFHLWSDSILKHIKTSAQDKWKTTMRCTSITKNEAMEIEARKQHKKLVLILVQSIKIRKVEALFILLWSQLSLISLHLAAPDNRKYWRWHQKYLSYTVLYYLNVLHLGLNNFEEERAANMETDVVCAKALEGLGSCEANAIHPGMKAGRNSPSSSKCNSPEMM